MLKKVAIFTGNISIFLISIIAAIVIVILISLNSYFSSKTSEENKISNFLDEVEKSQKYINPTTSNNDNGAIIGNDICDFDVKESSSLLIPVESITGKQIGFFERHSGGSVQLTTSDGYAPLVTECLIKKGYGDKLNLIELYQ